MNRAIVISAAVLLAACAAAIAIQEGTGALPLGLFNEERGLLTRVSWALCAGLVAALALLVFEAVGGRPTRVGGAVRGLIAAGVLVELGVTAVDLGLVSRSPTDRLGGPFWEHRSPDGPWVFFKKGLARHGFRAPEPYATDPGRPRLLFLGDSYVEGSGSHFACNYPQVAEAALAGRGLDVEVMNAGVAGYGPVDMANLLDLLVAEGYAFDLVVTHLFLENDFTDNLPATERRVVAGINFRFPRSDFLRLFHPLNTRTFRYAVFVATAASLTVPEHDMAVRIEGPCQETPEPLREVSPGLRQLVERRLAANYGPDPRLAFGEVGRALARMQRTADARGAKLVVVVFPDRILVDPDLQRLLPLDASRWQLERLRGWIAEHAAGVPVIDLAPALTGDSAWYRTRDTHLSDPGNVHAGRTVAEALAPALAALR